MLAQRPRPPVMKDTFSDQLLSETYWEVKEEKFEVWLKSKRERRKKKKKKKIEAKISHMPSRKGNNGQKSWHE